MLKRSLFLSILIIIVTISGHRTFSQNDDSKLENTILWKISRNDISFNSYLIGTHHFIASSFIDTSKIIQDIVKKTNTFVIETDTADMDRDYLGNALKMSESEYYYFNNDDDRKLLDTCLVKIAGRFFPYYNLKPMVLLLMLEFLTTQKAVLSQVNPNFKGIDMFFKEQGEKPGNKLMTLETPEEQIAMLLDSISIERQTEMLITYVKAYDKNPASVTLVDTCYKTQNLDCIYLLLTKGYNAHDEEILNSNRNKKWMKKLPQFINEGPTFIAVGALHLVGQSGLIRLLRNAGYTVTPIMLNWKG